MITKLYDNSKIGTGYSLGIEADTPLGGNETLLLFYNQIEEKEFYRILDVALSNSKSFRVDLISDKNKKQFHIHAIYNKLQ